MVKIVSFSDSIGCHFMPVQKLLDEFMEVVFLNGKSVVDLGLTKVSLRPNLRVLCIVPSESLDEADALAEVLGYRPATVEEFLLLLAALLGKDLGADYLVTCRATPGFWHLYHYNFLQTVSGKLSLFAEAMDGKQGEKEIHYCALYIKK